MSQITEELRNLAQLIRNHVPTLKVAFQPPQAFAGGPPPPPDPGVDPAMIAAQGGMPPAGAMPGQPVPAPGGGQPVPAPGGGQPMPPEAGAPGPTLPPELEQIFGQIAEGMEMITNDLQNSRQQQEKLQQELERSRAETQQTTQQLQRVVMRTADEAQQARNRVDYFEQLLKTLTPPPPPPAAPV